MPAKEHGNTASEDVEASSLLLSHEQAPVSEAGFLVRFSRRRTGHIQTNFQRVKSINFCFSGCEKARIGIANENGNGSE